MAQYCKNCYKEKINPLIKDEDLIYCADEAICDGCGELKHLVIEQKKQQDDPVLSIAECNIETQKHIENDFSDTSIITEDSSMTIAECNCETQKHIELVRKYIRYVTDKLTSRGVSHDASKLVSPEAEIFAKYTKLLANLTFDSPEYNACLEQMSVALKHHYSQNAHHPEHWPNGINDMSLIDIIEAVCDWKASSERQNDGNILQTINILAERFNITKQLKQIIINTIKLFEDIK